MLGLALFIALGFSCKDNTPKEEQSKEPVKVPVVANETKEAVKTPAVANETKEPEAKKLRLADIVVEMIKASEEVEKNPDVYHDPAFTERMQKLEKEGQVLLDEFTGKDKSKEDDVIIEVLQKYHPEYYGKLLKERDKAYLVQARTLMLNIKRSMEMYRMEFAKYPSDLKELAVETGNQPAYLSSDQLKDPWGNDFIYELASDGFESAYTIKSFGPDGKQGTEDDIQMSEID